MNSTLAFIERLGREARLAASSETELAAEATAAGVAPELAEALAKRDPVASRRLLAVLMLSLGLALPLQGYAVVAAPDEKPSEEKEDAAEQDPEPAPAAPAPVSTPAPAPEPALAPAREATQDSEKNGETAAEPSEEILAADEGTDPAGDAGSAGDAGDEVAAEEASFDSEADVEDEGAGAAEDEGESVPEEEEDADASEDDDSFSEDF